MLNAGEEGLGNLKGCRRLMQDYADKLSEVYSFDGSYKGYVNKAVGSVRYRVEVKTEGGHSYGAFGNRNADPRAGFPDRRAVLCQSAAGRQDHL